MTTLLDEEEGRDTSRRLLRAFGYMCSPSAYDHAQKQWGRQLEELAEREGYVIIKWYIDSGHRLTALNSMRDWLRGSGTSAIFVPHIGQLAELWGRGMHRSGQGDEREQLAAALGRQIFVLSDDFARIQSPCFPEDEPALPRGRQHWWQFWHERQRH